MTELIDHLLAERHRIQNQTIIDCLALARLAPSPEHRISATQLMEALNATSQQCLTNRLARLRRYELLDYKSGHNGAPGYLITRVGPA